MKILKRSVIGNTYEATSMVDEIFWGFVVEMIDLTFAGAVRPSLAGHLRCSSKRRCLRPGPRARAEHLL